MIFMDCPVKDCSFIIRPSEQGPDLLVSHLRKRMILQGVDIWNQHHAGKS